MIRPEAAAALRRYQELIVGVAVLGLGLYWALGTGAGLLRWIGAAVALAGAALAVSGVQRARFRRGSDGPGLVQVVEGRISYFGPLWGGVVALDDLSALSIDHTGTPAHWRLEQPGEPPLHIPVTAEGSDRLFDAFAHLPGLRTERLLRALEAENATVQMVWRAAGHEPAFKRLH